MICEHNFVDHVCHKCGAIEDKPEHKYEIENEEIRLLLNHLGLNISKTMPENWGFILLLAEYGEGGSTFYISSCQRDDVIKLLKEFIEKHAASVN